MAQQLDGANLWEVFDNNLADYAQKNKDSRGRKYLESLDPNRLPFQRDRDRIINIKSFRRLKGKTQVVSPGIGDHFRNRLSHTIEVSIIARDMARQLRLNEDLAEAVALAHDLGHPPFGHAGEVALDKKMQEYGLHFDHNGQSLRIVTFFERIYEDFPGLNLSLEVLEGIQKHETFFDRPGGKKIYSPHLESQLVDISDEIAYLSADLEDGLRGGFFDISELSEVEICREVISALPASAQNHRPAIIHSVIGRLFRQIVSDMEGNLKNFGINSLEDVQKCQERVVTFSSAFFPKFRALKSFLMAHYYSAPEVMEATESGAKIIDKIFDFLHTHSEKLPEEFLPEEVLEQRICDYIAGMTDGYAERFLKVGT